MATTLGTTIAGQFEVSASLEQRVSNHENTDHAPGDGVAWGWLGIVASSGAQVVSGNRAAAAPAANQAVEAGGTAGTAAPLTDRPEDEKAVRAMGETFTSRLQRGGREGRGGVSTRRCRADRRDMVNVSRGGRRSRIFIRRCFRHDQVPRSRSRSIRSDSWAPMSPRKKATRASSRPAGRGDSPPLHRSLRQAGWAMAVFQRPRRARDGRRSITSSLRRWSGWWASGSTRARTRRSTPLAAGRTDKNFLLRDFTVHVQGQPVMTVNQRIGWDPLTKQIKSWVFDSEGGYGDGLWTRRGNQWVIKSTGVLPDGRIASATHILTRVGPNSARWTTRNRSRRRPDASPNRLNTSWCAGRRIAQSQ